MEYPSITAFFRNTTTTYCVDQSFQPKNFLDFIGCWIMDGNNIQATQIFCYANNRFSSSIFIGSNMVFSVVYCDPTVWKMYIHSTHVVSLCKLRHFKHTPSSLCWKALFLEFNHFCRVNVWRFFVVWKRENAWNCEERIHRSTRQHLFREFLRRFTNFRFETWRNQKIINFNWARRKEHSNC